jgi:hypothetical protein
MNNDSPVPYTLIAEFQRTYDAAEKDRQWEALSGQFRAFWTKRVRGGDSAEIADSECDPIVRILDRNGKGNTRNSESVAKAMIPQGAWRRMFNEFHSNRELASRLTAVMEERDLARKAANIDGLYSLNEGQKNNLTGPSGNAVGAFLAAYDPINNLSIISLKDRRLLIDFFGVTVPFEWNEASIGTRLALTNEVLLAELRRIGIRGSARTASVFCYFPPVKALWKAEHTIRLSDQSINVTVPTPMEGEVPETASLGAADVEELRESMQIQALLAKIGTSMGFTIWLPRADRGRVLKAWSPGPGELIEELPLGYDSTTMKTIEQIDVLWLKRRSIVRAFEVEHTTSVYSGLLRMADLVALQPNININLHIVAPDSKQEKVFQEIQRPVFSMLEGRRLNSMCTFLSYDSVRQIADLKYLSRVSESIIEDFEQIAE